MKLPFTEGPTAVNPFTTVVLRVPTRTVNMEVKLPLPSKEGLTINSEISIYIELRQTLLLSSCVK